MRVRVVLSVEQNPFSHIKSPYNLIFTYKMYGFQISLLSKNLPSDEAQAYCSVDRSGQTDILN